MKTLIFLLCCISVASAQTPSLNATAGATNSATQTIVGYQIGVQDGNSRVWQKIVKATDPKGNVTYQTNQAYVELATGLNHLVNGQWMASTEEIDIAPDGNSALATNGQHQAYFPGDIYGGQIELVTPDGKQLYSRPVGLSYDDGTNTVLIAELTNSTGEILPSGNQVLYANAFTGFAADLRYTYTKAGFEQDIILRQQPPAPASFGLNPDTTKLQVLTEFFNPPQPTVTATTVSTDAGNLTDDNLSFGAMAMVPGKAFVLGTNSPTVGVEKQWLQVNGRQFLLEEVPTASIADELENLPQATSTKANPPLNVVSTRRLLPEQRLATNPGKHPMQLAKVAPSSSGLVLDYVTINSSLTNYTFQGDTTYYISGGVYPSGTNIFEGGTVLKYTNNAYLYFSFPAQINCLSSAYRPAIFTAKDDNSVGDTISGSTGNPTNYYASAALIFYGYGGGGSANYNISCFRIAWANEAIGCGYGTGNLSNGQLVNCGMGLNWGFGQAYLRNMLFANVQTNIYVTGVSVNAQNTTFSGGAYLGNSYFEGTITLTNCILANVTYLSGYFLNGDHNGFYNSPAFGSGQVTNTFYPFQTVGAGSYYLTNGCAFTNAGTTNIDPSLPASLAEKTTYPPMVYSNVTISNNMTLGPYAARDTNAAPDLGYHYDPIDYLVDKVIVANANLTVTNGAVLASYNEAGVQLQQGSSPCSIVSIGSPAHPNWFIRYSSVQEQAISLGGTNLASALTIGALCNGAYGPTGYYRFSRFACPAGCGELFYDTTYYTLNYSYVSLLIEDCELWSGSCNFSADHNTATFIKNNLFYRTALSSIQGAYQTSLSFSNNLFYGSSFTLMNFVSPNYWQAFDNSFDSCSVSGSLTSGHNGYFNCPSRLSPTNASDVVTNVSMAYQTGPLGTFYQPTNSPLLNMGSTNANLVGLYHYTVTTNEVVEGTNIVSIGYHYVATDTNGIPLDSNGDGIPDYLEDANGDGVFDAGDLGDWQVSPFGLSGGNALQVFTPLK